MVTERKTPTAAYTVPRNQPKSRAKGMTPQEVDKALVTYMLRWIRNADDADRLELATRIGRNLRRASTCDAANAIRTYMIATSYVGDVTLSHKMSCNVGGACPTCQGKTAPATNKNHVCCTRYRDLDEFQVCYAP